MMQDSHRVLTAALGGLLLLAAAGAVGTAAGADEATSTAAATVPTPAVVGTWLTENHDAKVRIEPCDDSLCGRLVWLEEPLDEHGDPDLDDKNPDPSLRDRPILGLQILDSFPHQPDEDGVWTGGRIYDPESGKTYKARLSLDGETLNLRGYVGVPLLGRTSAWTRTDDTRTDETHTID